MRTAPTDSGIPHDVFLSQGRALRALARGLVRDEHAADDVLQETWLRARGAPPAKLGSHASLRAWLAHVTRNLSLHERRGQARRAQREERVARAERQPSTLDVVEQRGVLRSVVEAVLALEEPYQTVVVLRFYEGLPPREIARRQNVPVATVKSQLARALQQLRGRLDREFGGQRSQWSLALVGPTRPGGETDRLARGTSRAGSEASPDVPAESAAARSVAALWRAAPWGLGLGAASLLVWFVLPGGQRAVARSPRADSTGPAPVLFASGGGAAGSNRALAPGQDSRRSGRAVAPVEPGAPMAFDVDDAPFLLTGTVVDSDDVPLQGADVYIGWPGSTIEQGGVTDANGRFQVSWPSDDPSSDTLEVIFGVLRSRTWAGLHRFELRRGEIQDVHIGLRSYREQLLASFERDLRERTHGQTDGVTWQDLDGLGIDPEDYRDPTPEDYLERGFGTSDSGPVRATGMLASTANEGRARTVGPHAELAGVVLDAGGQTAAGATVIAWASDGPRRTRTNRSGVYRFHDLPPGPVRLRAGGGDHGQGASTLELVSGQRATWNPTLDRGREIRGVVVDETGSPLSGWNVELVRGHTSLFADITTSARDGRFSLPNVAAPVDGEDLRLFLRAPRESWTFLASARIAHVRTDGAPMTLVVEPEQRATGRLSVRFTDSASQPFAHASVEVRLWQPWSGRGAWLAPTQDPTVYAIEDLPVGRYRVSAGVEDWTRQASAEVQVEAGREALLELVLEAPVTEAPR